MPSVLLALPLVSFAQDKHVHGEAELTIAFEQQAVVIEFSSPSANLLGFESAPKNAQESQAVESVRALLANYTNVIALIGGNCEQTSYKIEKGLDAQIASHDHKAHGAHEDHNYHNDHKDHGHHDDHKDHDHHHDHKGHDDHDNHKGHDHHDEHKDHGHHDDHKDHDHDHKHHDHDVHSDFQVSYTLECQNIAEITGLTFTGFSSFGGIEKLNLDWVTENHQGSSDLNAKQANVTIKQ